MLLFYLLVKVRNIQNLCTKISTDDSKKIIRDLSPWGF